MKVVFRTNLDGYDSTFFPDNLSIPPRIGESVAVNKVLGEYLNSQGLPLILKVVDVVWTSEGVVVELNR